MDEIQCAYTVYERTKNTTILEHIIIDIIKLFNNMLSPKRTAIKPSFLDIFGKKRANLIYYQSENNDDKISAESLIAIYLDDVQKKKPNFLLITLFILQQDKTHIISKNSLQKAHLLL